MTTFTKVLSTGATGLAALFAANSASAQQSTPVSVPVNSTSSGTGVAAANSTGGAANLNATIAPVQQSTNQTSVAVDASDRSQTAIATSSRSEATGGNGTASVNGSGNSQNSNASSASIRNKTPSVTFGFGAGIFTSPGELFGLDHPVQVMCDPETNKLVIVTHRSGVISGTATHIRAPKKDKGYMKAFGKNVKADPTSAYLNCPVEASPVNFTQAPPTVVVVPVRTVKEEPVFVDTIKEPKPTQRRRTTVKFHKPVTKATAKPVAATPQCPATSCSLGVKNAQDIAVIQQTLTQQSKILADIQAPKRSTTATKAAPAKTAPRP